jgi:enterochelin esterase family protein
MDNPQGNKNSAGQSRAILSSVWVSLFSLLLLTLVACGIQNPLATPTGAPPPPSPTTGPTPIPTPLPGSVAGFQQFLVEARALKAGQRQEKVNRYMAQLKLAPLTEGGDVIFLWQGAADSVHLTGDMNTWDADSPLALSRLEGSDLWYLLTSFEPEARLDYQFEINGISRQLDPLNPNRLMSAIGPNSVLKMPGYLTPPELMATDAPVSGGKLTSHTLESRFLNQTRTFLIYEPAGQIVGQKLPTLYLNDGGNYLSLIDTPALLDALIAQRHIPPMVVVFLPPVLALEEYSQNDDYVSFLANELVPFVQDNFGTDSDPASTGVMGAGVGGLAALYTAQSRPDVFGLAAGQSVANLGIDDGLSVRRGEIQSGLDLTDLPDRIYLVVGTYETAVDIHGERQNLLADNRRLANELAASSQEVQYEEMPEGHSWGLWQGTFGRALSYLYNKEP